MKRHQSGFTMMEVLVALSLMSLVAAFLSPAFVAQSQFNTTNELKTQAIEATDRQIDTLRFADPATLPATGSTSVTIPVGGRNFAVRMQYCLTPAYCSVVTRHIKFTATYRNKTYYETETVFTQLR